MTDNFTPEDQERIKELANAIGFALDGCPLPHAQTAIANVVAQVCLRYQENPDRVFLNTIDTFIGVFREASNQQLRGKDESLS